MYYRRIGELRIDNDIKQIDVAKYLGVTQGTYSGYESGQINIPVDKLVMLADFYHVSVDYLLNRTNKQSQYCGYDMTQGDEMIFYRIRELREDHDWNQEFVAEKLGIKQTTYSKYELGKVNVPAEALIKLADLYQVSLDYLMGRTDQ
jgi:transcriptional regulator with XRE-family HTH domain